jgi:hypothetical protein
VSFVSFVSSVVFVVFVVFVITYGGRRSTHASYDGSQGL